ncbi:hypothetical protein AVEN_165724-1 [Araneus ventricosus]|uniref:Uncharacterized protein n=1 Tax=Araneus ventricosus TaxID=182803 RepID=A0A4Y2C355_ARAVE|nr:hypothetical protein AVEN_165724-1 [Araneus ventricosus]
MRCVNDDGAPPICGGASVLLWSAVDVETGLWLRHPFRFLNNKIMSAPSISNIVARMHACFKVNTPEPTDVPNELATSFAPTPKAKKNAIIKLNTTIHMTSFENASNITPAKVTTQKTEMLLSSGCCDASSGASSVR